MVLLFEIGECEIFRQNDKERENHAALVCLCVAALLHLLFKISFSVLLKSAVVNDDCQCSAVTGQTQSRASACTLPTRPVMRVPRCLCTKNFTEGK